MIYDVAIIGAGVTGAMIARELGFLNGSVCVIEAESDLASGASRANSGIVHAGYDAAPGSMKAKMNRRGNEMMPGIAKELGVPYENCGSMVVAFDDADDAQVKNLHQRGTESGVTVELITGAQALAMEPLLSSHVTSALWAPTAGIICPFSLTIAAMENAVTNGVKLYLNSRVSAISQKDGIYTITAGPNNIQARRIVNAAGVYADDISRMAGGETFGIKARKGEYVLFDKSTPAKTHSVIFGAPSEKGKGVLFGPTAHGNMVAGPTAEFTEKDDNDTTFDGLQAVISGVKKYVPSVDRRGAITVFAGLRAVPDTHDFIIERSKSAPNLFNAAGIESPGLTSSPAIAEHMAALLVEAGLSGEKKPGAVRERAPIERFAEASPQRQQELIGMDGRYANVVCRCEYVTEAEIVQSINRPCGATTVDGVRLRTRAGMGRCHAGFCMPRVMAILAREQGTPYNAVTKSGPGAWILDGKTKEDAR